MGLGIQMLSLPNFSATHRLDRRLGRRRRRTLRRHGDRALLLPGVKWQAYFAFVPQNKNKKAFELIFRAAPPLRTWTPPWPPP